MVTVSTLLGFVGIIVILISLALFTAEGKKMKIIAAGVCVFGILICITCGICTERLETAERERLIATGYTVYVDGREVDIENIELSDYRKIKVDDEHHKILISTAK